MSRRCDVLALVTEAWGGHGGIARYNMDFAAAAAGMELSVHLLPRLGHAAGAALPAGVVQWPACHGRLAYAARAAARTVTARPGLVFCGHLFHGPLAGRLARLAGAALVSQLHGSEVWGALAPAHRVALERSDLVLAVSRDTRARILAATSLRPERVAVVPNTVDAAFRPHDRRAARARFGLAEERVVLTVGRLDARGYKGHDRVMPIVARARSEGADLVYMIAGEGADRQRLEALARTLDLTEAVRFLGAVPQADLPDLYRAADLFAMPSTGEGFGIVFIEATACGTPAIGLSVGGTADALCDGELGDLVAPEKFEAGFRDALDRAVRLGDGGRGALARLTARRFGAPAYRSALARALAPLLHRTCGAHETRDPHPTGHTV